MRLLAVLLIGLFTTTVLDLPFEILQKTPIKSCCCKLGICHCQHGEGKVCPLKKQTPQPSMPQKRQGPIFSASDCGFGSGQKATSPAYSKEFFIHQDHAFVPVKNSTPFLFSQVQNRVLLFDHRLDKPPRVFLFSL